MYAMNKIFLLLCSFGMTFLFAQSNDYKPHPKGSFFFYWGYNWDGYTKSDIHFKGDDYNFELKDVVARDRQSPFEASVYLNPQKLTIPQYNLRLGYFINDHYSISFGADHMKYVMMNDQTVKMTGRISNGTAYDGNYQQADQVLTHDFLLYEHTDGLNYLNVELRRFANIYARKNLEFNYELGAGAGVVMPKTNCTLMNNERHDAFHLAGYGIGVVGALNLTFFKYVFLQTELKGGFIHLPDVRTTQFKSDKASQHFFFGQINAVLGARFPLTKKKD